MAQCPRLAVDLVIRYPDGPIVLIKRGVEPYKGRWALPGGAVEIGETVEAAAVREAKEETGLDVQLEGLVGVYSEPDRDPRGHTVSVVFFAIPRGGTLAADTDAAEVIASDHPLSIPLAFDHDRILRDALSA